MKKVLSYTKTTIILLAVTVLFLGFYVYMLARPISYGMSYHNETVYEGVTFEGTLKFGTNGKVLNKNSTFKEAFENYYYYKDGHVFTLMAKNDVDYEAETAYINKNFDEAVASPFYAARINAFRQINVAPDGYTTTYTCNGAVIFAIAGGVGALALIALTASSFVLSKKAKSEYEIKHE
jgi:hypothetical protein